jgi:hypothetical protein
MKIGCFWRDDALQLASRLDKHNTTYLSQNNICSSYDVHIFLKFGQVPHGNMGLSAMP